MFVIVKQDEPSDWEESWKLSGAELEPEDDETQTSTSSAARTRMNEVFRPGWSSSWLLSAAPLDEDEERRKNWRSCWGYGQQIRWVNTHKLFFISV